jgi:hypothetical protein
VSILHSLYLRLNDVAGPHLASTRIQKAAISRERSLDQKLEQLSFRRISG